MMAIWICWSQVTREQTAFIITTVTAHLRKSSPKLPCPPAGSGHSGIVEFGVSWVDFDNDGFLDLFLTRVTADSAGNEGPDSSVLYHNNGNSNAWLEVKVVGTAANRSGIGAKVRAHATIGGKTFWQLREIGNGIGWNGQPLVAHFGLGDATNVDTLRIEWPSGSAQEIPNVAAKQILTITEPPPLIATMTNGVPQLSLKAWPGMKFAIQASHQSCKLVNDRQR